MCLRINFFSSLKSNYNEIGVDSPLFPKSKVQNNISVYIFSVPYNTIQLDLYSVTDPS